LSVQIQDGKGKLEIVKVQLNKPNPIPLVKMHNRLKEFGEFLLDNTLLKMQNHGLWGTKVPMERVVANNLGVHKGENLIKHGVNLS
jgi:hypothetical protein